MICIIHLSYKLTGGIFVIKITVTMTNAMKLVIINEKRIFIMTNTLDLS